MLPDNCVTCGGNVVELLPLFPCVCDDVVAGGPISAGSGPSPVEPTFPRAAHENVVVALTEPGLLAIDEPPCAVEAGGARRVPMPGSVSDDGYFRLAADLTRRAFA